MVRSFDYTFYLLCLSTLLTLSLFVYILRMKSKSQIHTTFLLTVFFIFIWSLGHILEVSTTVIHGYTNMSFVYLYYSGLIFVPISLLFTGLVFVKTQLSITWYYIWLLVFPVIDFLLLITNEYHGLYFVKYSIFGNEAQYGEFFIVHTIVQYIYIVTALYYFIRFSIKNSGFFSKQSLLIILGVLFPFVINILMTANLISGPMYFTPISFTITIFLFSFAILRLDFLNITPIALQRIVDLISDSFVIINRKYEVIDYNQTFINTFEEVYKVNRKDNLLDILDNTKMVGISSENLFSINKEAVETRKTISVERNFVVKTEKGEVFNKYFVLEITPIFNRDVCLGTIILFKDITQNKKDLETIKANQAIIMEQERMASLGHLIGGIAHNLKTPIMSISGGIEGLKELIAEYESSIGDAEVSEEDHREIARDMDDWLEKMKPHCTYMSDIISTVKGQATQFNSSKTLSFRVDELLKRVDLLMKHELKRYHCALHVESSIDKGIKLVGEVSALVQIFDNIIINSIHAYDGKNGRIDLSIQEDERGVIFAIRDYGKGMNPKVQSKLFKNMITTKGKEGTGLGLYMSYATVKGHFGGDLWFESAEGEGTTFYVLIPRFA